MRNARHQRLRLILFLTVGLTTAAFVLQLHDRIANLAAPSTDALALTLDEQRLPKRIRRPRA